jgi:ribose transport system substrate-binding protein
MMEAFMRKFLKPVTAWILFLSLVLGASPIKADGGKRYQIAVIPKGTTHIFWRTVHAGAAKAAKELGVDIFWIGAENEGDRKQEIDLVQNFISRKVDAIVLAPLDDKALVSPVEEAVKRGIPVVIIDSSLQSNVQTSFVATNNTEGGRIGADRLGVVMGGTGKALLLRYAEGSASTNDREEGFLAEMAKKFPGIEIVSSNQYGGVTKESALQASQNLLNKFPDVNGAFCPNESTAFGMLRALQISGKAGKVKFVGFDSSDDLLAGLKNGEVQGLVSQDPFDIGYQGVKAAVNHLKGKKVEDRIATKLLVVTKENMNTPKVKAIIYPNVDKWLK